jgi:hypothetical protein
MSWLFDPPARESVNDSLEAYAAYLEQRDGKPDFERRTLSARETDAMRFESAQSAYDGAFDAGVFGRQLRRYDVHAPTSVEMQLLLMMVKINANEAYGVESVIDRARATPAPAPGGASITARLHQIVLLEEGYHTRLLRSAARLFGVPVGEVSPPAALTRALVGAIAVLPEVAGRPVTLVGEILGIVTFERMIGAVRRIFHDRPALRDALEERIMEVLIDELGHVSFNRLLARRGTFGAARAILRAAALATQGAMPEAELLGIFPLPARELSRFDPACLPGEVRRRAFIA